MSVLNPQPARPTGASSRLRLQDGIAVLFILAFIGLGILTWRHLQAALRDIRRDASEATERYEALREVFARHPSPRPHDIAGLEERIADLERERGALMQQQSALGQVAKTLQDAVGRRQDEERGEIARGTAKGLRYVAELQRFDAGPEPDPLGPNVAYPAWHAWKTAKEAADAANDAMFQARNRIHQTRLELAAAVQRSTATLGQVEALRTTLSGLRQAKNDLLEAMRDPQRLQQLQRTATGVHWQSGIAIVLHAPFLVLCLAYVVSFAFRLAVMREWLGAKRLSHAG